MDYARDRRTKRIVQADKVRWTERNRAYECPVCKAAVHYRSAMGLSPYPGFAHNAHAARLDCDLYHPSLGGENSSVGQEHWKKMKPANSTCAWMTRRTGRSSCVSPKYRNSETLDCGH